MERTFIILKPDAVQRAIVGEIITRFERAGLKIVGMKMVAPDESHYYHHYETISKMISRRGQKAFDVTLSIMQAGPVIAAVLEGVEAVELVRKITGTTEPKAAAPGTIRGDYAHVSFAHADANDAAVANIIHASGNKQEAEAEITHWFSEQELFDYSTLHEIYTQPRKAKHE
jgi:nucleoside-diphosphate kinase